MAVTLPFAALNTFRLLRRLQSTHPEVWERLGSPSLVRNNSLQNHLSMRRWMRERRHEELNDPALTALVARERILGRVYIAFGVMAGVSFVLMLLTR